MNIISRKQAIEDGLRFYYTGKPCKNGHLAERGVAGRECIACRKSYSQQYYADNREAYKARDAAYYAENRATILARQKKSDKLNPERAFQRRRRYREKNAENVRAIMRTNYLKNRDCILQKQKVRHQLCPEKATAKVALRRARKKQAVPAWFSEFDAFVWQEAAELVRIRELETGIHWSADHMIPLAGRKVCGLHVAENCQVIPMSMNLEKNNKVILTERLEWLKHLLK